MVNEDGTDTELIITPPPRDAKKVVVTPYAKTQLAAAKRSAAAAKSNAKKGKENKDQNWLFSFLGFNAQCFSTTLF